MRRVHLQPAHVLHRRAYRETSFLVDLFTQEYGRVSLIARGVKKAKNATQGILQPFIPLSVSWSGKGDLMTLTHVEVDGDILPLRGDCLFAGFYLNELMMCLLQKWVEHTGLYNKYTETIRFLQSGMLDESTLRSFEMSLFHELGYGLFPNTADSLHNMLAEDDYYRFIPEQGFLICQSGEVTSETSNIFSGKSLLAIAQEKWDDSACLRDAKRLSRIVLAPLIGSRTIHSRRLFMPLEEHHES